MRCACASDSVAQVGGVGMPCRVQQQAGHRLVDAALDRAGVVVDGHAEFAQRMQNAEPLRHLLEGAARDAAHERRVGQRRGRSRG